VGFAYAQEARLEHVFTCARLTSIAPSLPTHNFTPSFRLGKVGSTTCSSLRVESILALSSFFTKHYLQSSAQRTGKMLHPDGIEVYVKSVDKEEAYKEYEKEENNETENQKHMIRYIEAVPGETYEIVLKLHPKFRLYQRYELHGGSGLHMQCSIDKLRQCRFLDESYLSAMVNRRSYTRSTVHRKIGAEWRTMALSFADLTLGVWC
jgi:hypothetical protein